MSEMKMWKKIVAYFTTMILLEVHLADIRMVSLDDCNPPNAQHSFTAKLKYEEGKQYIKGELIMRTELNNDNYMTIEVFRIGDGNKSTRLLNLKQTGACKALTTLGGATYFDIASKAQIPEPNKCPLQPGTYSVDWYYLNFEASPLSRMMPKGRFRLKMQEYTSDGKDRIVCFDGLCERLS